MAKITRAVLLGVALLMVAAAGCGDDGCPGVTCTNCARDCSLDCPPGKTNVCTAHPDDPTLRCEYCD